MEIVILCALGVGGATIIGALIGFLTRGISHKFGDVTLAFAAGVMLAAAVIGLILPSLEYGGEHGAIITAIGLFLGAVCIHFLDFLVSRVHKLTVKDSVSVAERERREGVALFVLAIAIHNLPEGIAAGVAFGTDNIADALICAIGIALQNLPEGMVIIAPMMSVGIPPWRTLFLASLTGVVEIVGTFIGYFAVSVARAVLPVALAFAGGTMLYVINDEMIPETHSNGCGRAATYSMLVGFCFMLIFSELLS